LTRIKWSKTILFCR